MRSLAEYDDAPCFAHEERLVLRLADAMAGAPAAVPEPLYAELSATFSEAQLVELASAIAWENYRARFNLVFGVEAEGYSAGSFCPLPVRPDR